jgi:hypothetical protein
MAIKGIILENSYAVVDDLNINKKDKMFSFNFIIYKDETKKDVLLRNHYLINSKYTTYSTSLIYSSMNKLREALELTEDKLKDIKIRDTQEIVENPPMYVIINPDNPEEDGIYNISYSKVIEIDTDNKEINKYPILFEKNNRYSCIYSIPNKKYYIYENNKFDEFNGLNTDLFFDTYILKQVATDTNMIGIGYSILKMIDPFYGGYENV